MTRRSARQDLDEDVGTLRLDLYDITCMDERLEKYIGLSCSAYNKGFELHEQAG